METPSDLTPCTICEIRHLSSTATVWCPDCEDALCNGCKEHHSISKGTKEHDTIPVEDYRKIPAFILNIQRFCENHDEKFEMYCLNHEKPLCKKCILTTHRDCKDTKTLAEVTRNIKSSWAMETADKRANEVIHEIRQIEDDRANNLASIYETKDMIIRKVSETRDHINQHLDRLQTNMVDELLSLAGKGEKDISEFLEILKAKREKIDEIRNNIERIKMHGSDRQSFFALKEMENRVSEGEKYLHSAFHDGRINQVKIEYSIDTKMTKFASSCSTFGNLSITTTTPTIRFKQQGSEEAQVSQNNSILDIKLIAEREIKIGNTLEVKPIGCCVMPDGNIMFSCYTNRIAVHGSDGSYQHEIPTSFSLIDISTIDPNTVAATTGLGNKILFYNVQNKLEARHFYVGNPCFGITYSDGSLIICVDKVGLQRLDVKTLKLSTILKEAGLDIGSFVAKLEDKTYFTNNTTKTLKVLDANMTEIWRFHDETVLPDPTGVTVDQHGNVYVADYKYKQLFVMSSDGKHRKTLKYISVMSDLLGLFYIKATSRIIVVNHSGKALLIDCA